MHVSVEVATGVSDASNAGQDEQFAKTGAAPLK